MSKTPSISLPPSLPAVDETRALADRVIEACELLAGHKFFGLVWLDSDLRAVERYGEVADLVPIGERVTESVIALWGLDDELRDLQGKLDARFEMPNVAMAGADGNGPRLNFHVFWQAPRQQFLLLIAKVVSTGDLEMGLAQQVRARMIVEAELAQQSRALAAVNAELSRANRDLAEFAYIISHDLKSPLRAMRYFTEDLERSLDQAGGGNAKGHAAQIRAQSHRMSRMLTDLLAYSRIGRQTEALATVDTNALIKSIVGSMPRDTGVAVEVSGTWPLIETYPAPLDLILRNLISNAVAHHDLGTGRVSVAATVNPGTLDIEIADDGPGIAPEWHDAIFQPFRTIGTIGAAGNSGIGLALVRKAVETHGATLTLLSDPKVRRGAIFTLSWPIAPKA
jgi:signal transduction histidine kinase